MKKIFQIMAVALVGGTLTAGAASQLWVDYDGREGPGKGRRIVLFSGDEEYRSEEALPALGKILSVHHGFSCRVVFSVDADTGLVNPNNRRNTPGLEALNEADLMIIATRFRDLPDGQMKYVDAYLKTGKPVIGMRTSTHGFQTGNPKWKHYSNGYNGEKSEWKGGFGRLVLGEKWINHHGHHGREATRGLIAPGAAVHAIARGLKDGDIFGPTDVYGVRLPLPGDSAPIILGQVVAGMNFDDPPLKGKKNDPLMPVGWTKSYQTPGGKKGRVFNTTMGSSNDLLYEGTRRMLVNAIYWVLGMEKQIPATGSKVDLVGKFKPAMFGFKPPDYWPKQNIRPSDFRLERK